MIDQARRDHELLLAIQLILNSRKPIEQRLVEIILLMNASGYRITLGDHHAL